MKISDIPSVFLVLSGLIFLFLMTEIIPITKGYFLVFGIIDLVIGIVGLLAVRYSLKRK